MSEKTGVRADDMVFADVYQNRIYKLYANVVAVAAIRVNDVTFCYEVSSPKDDHLRLQVVHRKDKKKGYVTNGDPEVFFFFFVHPFQRQTDS